MTTPAADEQRCALHLLANPDRDRIEADDLARFVLPYTSSGARWGLLDQLRRMRQRAHDLTCAQAEPLIIALDGETSDQTAVREAALLSDAVAEQIFTAVEEDRQAAERADRARRYPAAFVSVPGPRQS